MQVDSICARLYTVRKDIVISVELPVCNIVTTTYEASTKRCESRHSKSQEINVLVFIKVLEIRQYIPCTAC